MSRGCPSSSVQVVQSRDPSARIGKGRVLLRKKGYDNNDENDTATRTCRSSCLISLEHCKATLPPASRSNSPRAHLKPCSSFSHEPVFARSRMKTHQSCLRFRTHPSGRPFVLYVLRCLARRRPLCLHGRRSCNMPLRPSTLRGR